MILLIWLRFIMGLGIEVFVCDAVAVLVLVLVLAALALRWHPQFASGLRGLSLCGAALTFFAAAKKVSKESGLTPPACVLTHGPPTSPQSMRQLARVCPSPTLRTHASSASCSRAAASGSENHSPICGKQCVGCCTTNVWARNVCWQARMRCDSKAYTQFAAQGRIPINEVGRKRKRLKRVGQCLGLLVTYVTS
jgi:hypothetical protein